MDPQLAEILRTLAETSGSSAAQPPPVAAPGLIPQGIQQHRQFPQPTGWQLPGSVRPSQPGPQIYQPDFPPLPQPSRAVPRIDPRTITDWPGALKYISTVVAVNQEAMDKLKKVRPNYFYL